MVLTICSKTPRASLALVVMGSLLACTEPDGESKNVQEGSLVTEPSGWFTEIADDSGVVFRHSAGAAREYATPEITGSGAAMFDYDGDGDVDLYLVDVTSPGGAPRTNRLFRQDAGGLFTDVTSAAGLGDRGYGMGAVFGDIDNDGDVDLFVTNLGSDALYINDGSGGFRSAAPSGGFDEDVWSTSACFFDYDRDGLLDVYVATYLRFEWDKACTDRAGNLDFCGPEAFRGIPDRLYRGRGDGTFSDVSGDALPGRPANKALGVICADFNQDDLPDIYVANDGEENQFWINRGEGRFAEQAVLRGVASNLFGQPEASMGVVAGDLDGDLDLDLFMTHLDRETNTFYANLGDANFEDRTPATGLGPVSMARTGFGTAVFDADHDGDLDLALVNGRVRRGASLSDRDQRQRLVKKDASVPSILEEYAEANLFFLNEGGARFRDASAEAGWQREAAAVSRGLLAEDIDLDGDLDLLVTNGGSRPRLYRNDLPGKGHWLSVEAFDDALRREAFGASLEVEAGSTRQLRTATSTQGYLAAARARAHFGLDVSKRVERLVVHWPGGGTSAFADLPVDRTVRVFRRGESRRKAR